MKRILIALVFVLSAALYAVPLAAAQSSFSFKISCKGNTPFSILGSADGSWNWTVNGVKENGGFITCNTSGGGFSATGSGTVPSNANGIVASLSVQRANCFKTVSTTQSFTSHGTVSVSLKADCTGFKAGVGSLSISASFTLKN